MANSKFNMKVKDLKPTDKGKTAQEELIVRALFPRDGKAGATNKWEVFFLDDDDAESVLLSDAWGPNIATAKKQIEHMKVYKITNYAIVGKGIGVS